jgi:hypothetical protein
MYITHHKPSHQPEVFPILVPCEKGRAADGIANFYPITQAPGPKVRLLRNTDIISEEAIKRSLSVKDQELLKATLALKGARERNDPLMPADVYRKLMVHLGWPKGTDPKVFSYPGWANVHVPRLATKAMEGARLVLWYLRAKSGSGKFIPAIYCADLKSAIFARAFLLFRTCPHCGVMFLPEKDNVIYCCFKHGHAHRVARMRAKRRR